MRVFNLTPDDEDGDFAAVVDEIISFKDQSGTKLGNVMHLMCSNCK